jgi:hypothetical protein
MYSGLYFFCITCPKYFKAKVRIRNQLKQRNEYDINPML